MDTDQIKTDDDAIKAVHEEFANSFMKPKCYLGKSLGENHPAFTGEFDQGGLTGEDSLDYDPEGYYCRLSADGYMDCTDWAGPFDTMVETAIYLIDTYGE